MAKDNKSFNHKEEYKNLKEAFNQVQQMRQPSNSSDNFKEFKNNKKVSTNSDINTNISNSSNTTSRHSNIDKINKTDFSKVPNKKGINHSKSNTYIYYADRIPKWKIALIVLLSILLLVIVGFLIFLNSSEDSFLENLTFSDDIEFEINKNSLELQEIIPTNADMSLAKQQIVEERPIEFEIISTENASLPKGEEVISQEGVNGAKNVLVVQTLLNSEVSSEILLEEETILDFVPQIVEIGTSEFLANLNIHIGDTVYLSQDSTITKYESTSSNVLFELSKYLDVELIELVSEDICKVSFDGTEGYTNTSNLTSTYLTSNIVEKSRIQRIILQLNSSMKVNVDSGLTLDDFKTALSGISINNSSNIKNNYSLFYEMEQTYNINGLFLASVILYEENYSNGTANEYYIFNNNIIDSTNTSNSITTNDLALSNSQENTNDTITTDTTVTPLTFEELVKSTALLLVEDYINPIGIKINSSTYSSGWYYDGSTISDISNNYAYNSNWANTIYSYMESMYNNLSI